MSLPACETDTTWLGTLNKKQLPPPRAKRKELIRRRPLRGLLLAARPVRALRHRGRKTAWAPRQRAWPGNCGESVPWGGRDALCPFAASGEKHHQLSRALSFRELRPANGRLALQARASFREANGLPSQSFLLPSCNVLSLGTVPVRALFSTVA
jgi:hypothetical protein